MTRRYAKLNDATVEAMVDFHEGPAQVTFDTQVRGLQVRIGKKRVTWTYLQEHQTRGKRSTTCKRLGHFPAMGVVAARKAALQEAGKVAAGRLVPGRRSAMTLKEALDDYVEHLREQSKRKGKEALWARNATSFIRRHLVPAFGNWSLAELSNAPASVRDFHRDVSRDVGPFAANQCCRIMSAAYKMAARLDRSLPPHNPCSAVRYNPETPSTAGLAFTDFPKWREAWEHVKSPARRSYYLCGLLTGARPGELARLEWRDIDMRARTLVIRHAKAGADITIPLSAAIARALKLARGADPVKIFPGCNDTSFDHGLPAAGRSLRRTFRTIAADLGVNEILVRLLMGHSLIGINQSYINAMMLTGGPGLRDAQRQISGRIVELLRLA